MEHPSVKAAREARAQWDIWLDLYSEIKELERMLLANGAEGEQLEGYQARLAELRVEEAAAHKVFEKLLKKVTLR